MFVPHCFVLSLIRCCLWLYGLSHSYVNCSDCYYNSELGLLVYLNIYPQRARCPPDRPKLLVTSSFIWLDETRERSAVLLGITSWSIMNGLWVELPILVVHLPEGWTLPSLLTIICQFGNIGPIVFSLLAYFMPKRKIETPTSFVIVVTLTLCAVLYAFLWRQTASIGADTYSVALLSLTLCQAIFAATTSMAYLAFMAHLKAQYIGSIFIGMSLSGLIPALAAIGQNPGEVRCVETTGNYVTAEKIAIDTMSDLTYSQISQPTGVNTSSYSLSEENLGSLSLHGSHIISTLTSLVLDQELVSGSVSQNHSNVTLTPYNEEPAFTVQSFFLMLASMGGLSFISLLLLIHHPYCKTEHVDTAKEDHCQLVLVNR
ncbi:hypothetical protein Btru_054521 [Bulinus truncatus]|nr:hypothetical protein Btru_054521 [Bulinus truncatus]